MDWCYALASVTGSSHIRAGTRLQDAKQGFVVTAPQGDSRFVAIVSDGAGSAEFGGQGASIVCRTMTVQARDYLRTHADLPDNDVIRSWLDIARDRICLAAARRNTTPREFAATMILLVASAGEIVTAHIGDGAIVARERDSFAWSVLSAPHNGEYASTTYFVTDDPHPVLRISRLENIFSSLAAFSDGIESLVLDSVSGTASPAFFTPMARPLDASLVLGKDLALSKSLASFLAGDRLNERTDDDKTLIIAVTK
jgi:hypothetical protein